MKWFFFIVFMNLYLSYKPVELVSCDERIQVEYANEVHTLELFNVEVFDQMRVCELLETANTIEIAFEPDILQEDILSAWVMVDQKLLQQILIDEEVATVIRQNPLYQYNLKKEAQTVGVTIYEPITVNQSRGILILVVHGVMIIFLLVMMKTVKY